MPEQVQTSDDIREVVRERYAKAAREVGAAPRSRPAAVAGRRPAARAAARTRW